MSHCFTSCCVARDRNWHALGEVKDTSYHTHTHSDLIHTCFFTPKSRTYTHIHTLSPNAQLSNYLPDIKAKLIKQTPMPDSHTFIQVHTHKQAQAGIFNSFIQSLILCIFIHLCLCSSVMLQAVGYLFTGVSSSIVSRQLDRHNKYIREMQLRCLFKGSYCCGGVDQYLWSFIQ